MFLQVGVAHRDIVEKFNFEIDSDLTDDKDHGFYVIDSDGFYYKNKHKGKLANCGFSYNENNVIVGCNWEPVFYQLLIIFFLYI